MQLFNIRKNKPGPPLQSERCPGEIYGITNITEKVLRASFFIVFLQEKSKEVQLGEDELKATRRK